jgi:hypothetical protein
VGWTAFRQEVVRGLDGLTEADIRIVGSARLGFSLRPRNHLREFREESDIDVAVVNATLFDWLWMEFASEVSKSLENPNASVSAGAKKYAHAIEKGSNDKARRLVRHEVVVELLTPHLKKRGGIQLRLPRF